MFIDTVQSMQENIYVFYLIKFRLRMKMHRIYWNQSINHKQVLWKKFLLIF